MGLSSQSISREAESRQLVWRLLTALVGVPLVIGAIWAGLPWLTILVGLAALLALRELYGMAFGPRLHPLMALGALWTGFFIAGGHFTDDWYEYTIHLMLGAGLVLALPWLAVIATRRSWPAWGYGIVGPIYVGFLLAHSLMLRGLDAEADYGRGLAAVRPRGDFRYRHWGLRRGQGGGQTSDGAFHQSWENLGGRVRRIRVGHMHCPYPRGPIRINRAPMAGGPGGSCCRYTGPDGGTL